MKKKIVFICGPFRHPNEFGRRENIRRAEIEALRVWMLGMIALCPHLNTAHFDGTCPDAVFLEGDLQLLEKCDAVLLVPGWTSSVGAKRERYRALELNIPVFESIHDLHCWKTEQERPSL